MGQVGSKNRKTDGPEAWLRKRAKTEDGQTLKGTGKKRKTDRRSTEAANRFVVDDELVGNQLNGKEANKANASLLLNSKDLRLLI